MPTIYCWLLLFCEITSHVGSVVVVEFSTVCGLRHRTALVVGCWCSVNVNEKMGWGVLAVHLMHSCVHVGTY